MPDLRAVHRAALSFICTLHYTSRIAQVILEVEGQRQPHQCQPRRIEMIRLGHRVANVIAGGPRFTELVPPRRHVAVHAPNVMPWHVGSVT